MIVTIVGLAATSFIAFSLGWVRGYEQKEIDVNQIQSEMNEFWKEVEEHGVRNDSI